MTQRAGFAAIVGRPNVGKSTLLNRLVGEKISITSRKAQTTRHRIRGVLTRPGMQCVFVDTPGYQTQHRTALNRSMNRSVLGALAEVSVILLVLESGTLNAEDRDVLAVLPNDKPVLLVLTKIDRLVDKDQLLPFIQKVSTVHAFAEIIPVSAQKGTGVERLVKTLETYLPEAEMLFGEDEITDRPERFLAAEFVREKLFRLLGDELPYGMTVDIDSYKLDGDLRRIYATILVDKPAHKAMVIGKGGERLKRIGSEARMDMERLFGSKVFLELWVKVKGGWSDDERSLARLGYE